VRPLSEGAFGRPHQYVDRESGRVVTERLFADRWVRRIYCEARENAPRLFAALVSPRMSQLLGFLHFDASVGARLAGVERLARRLGIDTSECLEPASRLSTPKRLFERKIRYPECRPMPDAPGAVVSPADARMLVAALSPGALVPVKGKFFDLRELVGVGRGEWFGVFRDGDVAVFRLTPDKYHYNHTPVAGRVLDVYGIEGDCHSCNPAAVVSVATPYSKNRRFVTVIDTDTGEGTGVGRVAMVEVAALMIGGIRQCYSEEGYERPRPVTPGMFLRKGRPKSVFLPGSSVVVLLFEKGRVRFDGDILANLRHPTARSRFSMGFGPGLVETDVRVRSRVAVATGGARGNR
jgi:phosphatidylserine decarboxylase